MGVEDGPDWALVRVLVDGDPLAHLRERLAAGLSAEQIATELSDLSHGLVTFSAQRLAPLLEVAAPVLPSQIEQDVAAIEAIVGMPVGVFVRESIAAGRSASHMRHLLRTQGDLRIPMARLVDLIEAEKRANGPFRKPKDNRPASAGPAPTPTATHPDRASETGSEAKAKRRRRGSREEPKAPKPKSAKAKAADAQRRLTGLEQELERNLSIPLGDFLIKHAKIETARGISEAEVFAAVARKLEARFPRELTEADVEWLLRRHGWKTKADRRRERRERAEAHEQAKARARQAAYRSRGPNPLTSSGDGPKGFWERISTQRHVRAVGGGLPSLGKRR